ncbi:MAG: hypothetical protein ACYC0Q_01600 [Eubacteriales bacterium]
MDNEKFQELVLQQLQALAKGQNQLTEGQNQLSERLNLLERGQARLEISLENEVIEKIRALFDAIEVHLEYFASIKDNLARIEDRVGFLARQNVEHLTKLQEHERELRLLRLEKTK